MTSERKCGQKKAKQTPPLNLFCAATFLIIAIFAIANKNQWPIVVDGADVLISPSWINPVHRFTMRELAAELIRRNHSVTWFEYGLNDRSNKRTNNKIVLPTGIREIFVPIETETVSAAVRDIYLFHNHSIHRRIWDDQFWDPAERVSGWLAGIELCDQVLADRRHRAVFDSLLQKRFHAVIIDDLYNPCALLYAGLKRSIFVYWSMTGLRTESAWANQSPSPPAYIPVPGTGLTDQLNFAQRTYNLFAYMRQLYTHQHIVLRRVDALSEKHFPNKNNKFEQPLPSAFLTERNASINFVNHPPIFDFARPYMPRVNFVGGLHCKNGTTNVATNKTSIQATFWNAGEWKMSPELKMFVNSAGPEFGFILITGGFSVQWDTAPVKVIRNVVQAIQLEPDKRFVWQYNGDMERLKGIISNLTAEGKEKGSVKNAKTNQQKLQLLNNLFVEKWLPQQALLGHPNCRAHLTHGGLNSVIESVWHGVPVIGWPLTASAYDNLLRVTARQGGIMLLDVAGGGKRPTVQQLRSAFIRIYTRFYTEEMRFFQDLVTDVPYTELNHSAFWVDFIIRHQEVPHARSGADQLNILQYFLVDVVCVLFTALAVAIFTLYMALKYTIRTVKWLICCPFKKRSGQQKNDAKELLSRGGEREKLIHQTEKMIAKVKAREDFHEQKLQKPDEQEPKFQADNKSAKNGARGKNNDNGRKGGKNVGKKQQ